MRSIFGGQGRAIGALALTVGLVAASCSGTVAATTTSAGPTATGAPSVGSAPAGAHECASATRGEIDQFFGVATAEGVYNSPLITVAVCVWENGGSTLVLTLYPDPGDGSRQLASDAGRPELVTGLGTEAWWVAGDDASLLVVDLGSTILQLEWETPESMAARDRLIELAAQMIPRIPGAESR